MTEITKLLDRWATDEGKPYKGSLIDWQAYEADTDNIGCMCAQGQVLHLLGGWTADQLRDTEQAEADLATTKLLNISRAHAILLRSVNDTQDGAPAIVLTHPEKIIGDNARTVLAFWLALDGFTKEQWDAAWAAAPAAAWNAAWNAAWAAAWNAAWDAAGDAAWDAAGASNEIQGANLMRERGQPFFFLPLFGFANPEAIPPLPADYGGGVMTDIVERLQVHADIMARDKGKWVRFIDAADCAEAAATITELRAENARLREELMQIEVDAMEHYHDWMRYGCEQVEATRFAFDLSQFALEALKVEPTK